MAQGHLWAPQQLPTTLRIECQWDHVSPTLQVGLSALCLDQHHVPMNGSYMRQWKGVECDMLPDAAKAAVEAFMWADGSLAIARAVRTVQVQAQAHRLAQPS